MYQEVSFKTEQVIYAHTRSDEADMEYKMHCHNSYEIYYMITGNVEYLLEGRSYCPRPGSLLVITPGCFHGLRVLDGNEYDRIRVHFTEDLLNGKERELLLKPFGTGWGCLEEQFPIEWYFHAIEECGTYGKELQNIAIRTRILSLLAGISAIYVRSAGRVHGAEGQAQEIIRYINSHLRDYILYKRMTIARKELAMGTPAAEAASRAGFGDYSSFFRAYRKMFGCAPTDKTAMELPDMDKSGDF